MSLLLDALNKADQDRKRSSESPNISSNHDVQLTHATTKPLNKILLVIVGILLVLLLAAVYWLGKKNQQTSLEKNSVATSTQATQKIEPTTNKPSVIHLGDATTTNNADSINNNEETISLPAKTATELADDESIATLYHQQANNTVPIPKSNTTEAESNQQIIANNTATVPAASPMSITQFANIPDIQDLPSNVLQRIPSLKYSEHNYNNNGGSVVINGAIKHANDQLSEGLVIDKILEDGMILHFENYSFKMRAMNTWLNM